MATYITYDVRSGQIISVHHGAPDVNQAHQPAHHHSKIDQQHMEVISIQHETLQKGKRYKVDHGRKVLVEAAAGEGLSFSFGETARMGAR